MDFDRLNKNEIEFELNMNELNCIYIQDTRARGPNLP